MPLSRLFLAVAMPLFLSVTLSVEQNLEKCLAVEPTENKCNSQYVKFYIYTRTVQDKYGEFVLFKENGENTLNQSSYSPERYNVVIIHGYADNYMSDGLQYIKNEYLRKDKMNVWLVDYSDLVKSPCYVTSTHNMEYVGRCLALFIDALGNPKNNLHVIGFSLGAHAAAYAVPWMSPYLIPWVTGLDPAGPLFYTTLTKKLSSKVGIFVDVLHSNAFLQGSFLRLGHVDFFMNGGVIQPGCGNEIFKNVACSHARTPLYYGESINSDKGFWGWSCRYFRLILGLCKQSTPFYIMGDKVNHSISGLIYVPTNDRSPFALGMPSNTSS